jgi:hypothetical protein
MKDKLKKFVDDHADVIILVNTFILTVGSGYTVYRYRRDVGVLWKALDIRGAKYDQLITAVADGHDFIFQPETSTLWDLTVNPEKAKELADLVKDAAKATKAVKVVAEAS